MDVQCCWLGGSVGMAGAGQTGVFSYLCLISSLASVRNSLDHIFGGVLGKGNPKLLKRRDGVTLQVFKESPSGLA